MFPLRCAELSQLPPVERRPFGSTGLQVSALGFGGANIGFTDISDNILDRIFGAALDSGVNLIDTAAMYGDSENKLAALFAEFENAFFFVLNADDRSLPSVLPRAFSSACSENFAGSRESPKSMSP